MKAMGAVTALACALVAGGPAFGAAHAGMPSGGQIRVFVDASTNGATQKILVTGAIGDYGTSTSVDKNGTVDPNGDYEKVVMKKGGFEVNTAALDRKFAKAPATFNRVTCSFSFTGSAPVTLSDGTGLYTGISGTVVVTANFGGIGPRLASGPHKGQCNPNHNAKSVAQYGAIIGTGAVKF